MKKLAAVYMMSNKKDGPIYIGSADDVRRRVPEHKSGLIPGFTQKYKLTRCVYIELCPTTQDAIRMERRYKKYNRQWKIDLIEKTNPDWEDLYEKFNELLPF